MVVTIRVMNAWAFSVCQILLSNTPDVISFSENASRKAVPPSSMGRWERQVPRGRASARFSERERHAWPLYPGSWTQEPRFRLSIVSSKCGKLCLLLQNFTRNNLFYQVCRFHGDSKDGVSGLRRKIITSSQTPLSPSNPENRSKNNGKERRGTTNTSTTTTHIRLNSII